MESETEATMRGRRGVREGSGREEEESNERKKNCPENQRRRRKRDGARTVLILIE